MLRKFFISAFIILQGVGVFAQTTYTVSNTNDTGTGSLRAAITSANSATTGGPLTIKFDLCTGSNEATDCNPHFIINLATALPNLTPSLELTIDGTLQKTCYDTETNNQRVYISNGSGSPGTVFSLFNITTGVTTRITIKGIGLIHQSGNPQFTSSVHAINNSGQPTSQANGVILDDIEFRDIDYCVKNNSSSKYMEVKNCLFNNFLNRGVTSSGASATGLNIHDNIFVGNTASGSPDPCMGIQLSAGDNALIEDNAFFSCKQGIQMTTGATNTTVNNNKIYGFDNGTGVSSYGVFIPNSTPSVNNNHVITNNQFGTDVSASSIFYVTPTCSLTFTTDRTIRHYYDISYSQPSAPPVTTSIEIKNNTFYTAIQRAIYLAQSNATVEGNTFGSAEYVTTNSTYTSMPQAIEIPTAVSNILIKDNLIRNSTSFAINLNHTNITNTTVDGNEIFLTRLMTDPLPSIARISVDKLTSTLIIKDNIINGGGTGINIIGNSGTGNTSISNISGNIIGGEDDYPVSGYTTKMGFVGIQTTGTTNFVVDGNTVFGCLGDGMVFYTTSDLTITNNVVGMKNGWDTATPSDMINWVRGVTGTGINVVSYPASPNNVDIKIGTASNGNFVTGSGKHGITVNTCSACTTGNVFEVRDNIVGRPIEVLDDALLGNSANFSSLLSAHKMFGNGIDANPSNYSGIYINGSVTSTTPVRKISNNQVYKNFYQGINVTGTTGVEITQNECFLNKYNFSSYDAMNATNLSFNISLNSSGNSNKTPPVFTDFNDVTDVVTGTADAASDVVEIFTSDAASSGTVNSSRLRYKNTTTAGASTPFNWSMTQQIPETVPTLLTGKATGTLNTSPYSNATLMSCPKGFIWSAVCKAQPVVFSSLITIPADANSGGVTYEYTFTWTEYQSLVPNANFSPTKYTPFTHPYDGAQTNTVSNTLTGTVKYVSGAWGLYDVSNTLIGGPYTVTNGQITVTYNSAQTMNTQYEGFFMRIGIVSKRYVSSVLNQQCTTEDLNKVYLNTMLGVKVQSPYYLCVGDVIDFSATANKPEYAPYCTSGNISYNWTVVSKPTGAGISFSSSTSATPTAQNFDITGTYLLKVTVSDNLTSPATTVSDYVTVYVTEYKQASYKTKLTDCAYKVFESINELLSANVSSATCIDPINQSSSVFRTLEVINSINNKPTINEGTLEEIRVKSGVNLITKVMALPLSCNFDTRSSGINRQVKPLYNNFVNDTKPTKLVSNIITGGINFNSDIPYMGVTMRMGYTSSRPSGTAIELNFGGVNPNNSNAGYTDLDYTYYGECGVYPLAYRIQDHAVHSLGSALNPRNERNSVYNMYLATYNTSTSTYTAIDLSTVKRIKPNSFTILDQPVAATANYSAKEDIRFTLEIYDNPANPATSSVHELTNVCLVNGYALVKYKEIDLTQKRVPVLSSTATQLCSSTSSITLTAYPSGLTSYEWEVPGITPRITSSNIGSYSNLSMSGNTLTVNNATGGVYKVFVDGLVVDCDNVSEEATASITIYRLPDPAFTVANRCAGNGVQVTNTTAGTSTPSGASFSYLWTVTFNSTSTNYTTTNLPSGLFTAAGTYTVDLKVVGTACTTAAATNTFEVYPVPAITINGIEGSVCNVGSAGTGEMTLTLTNPVVGGTYSYTTTAGPYGSLSSPGFDATVGNLLSTMHATTVTAEYSDADGNTTCAVSQNFTIPYWGILVDNCVTYAYCNATSSGELNVNIDFANWGIINTSEDFVEVSILDANDEPIELCGESSPYTNSYENEVLTLTANTDINIACQALPLGTYTVRVVHKKTVSGVTTTICDIVETLVVTTPTVVLNNNNAPKELYQCAGEAFTIDLEDIFVPQVSTQSCTSSPAWEYVLVLKDFEGNEKSSTVTGGVYDFGSDLESGIYYYEITETNTGCSNTGYFDLKKVNIPVIDLTVANPLCYGGEAAVTVDVTDTEYSYVTFSVDSDDPVTSNPVYFVPGTTTSHTMVATVYPGGCSNSPESFTTNQPAQLALVGTYDIDPAIDGCTAHTVEATGGTPNYTFTWHRYVGPGICMDGTVMYACSTQAELNNLRTEDAFIVQSVCTTTTGVSTCQSGALQPGYYYVRVTDANGCTVISEMIKVDNPEPVERTFAMNVYWDVTPPAPPAPTVPAPETMNSLALDLDDCIALTERNARKGLRQFDNPTDNLTLSYDIIQTQFTLYYYDRARNLIATVPPNGTAALLGRGLDFDWPTALTDVTNRSNAATTEDIYQYFQTTYQYNTYNMLVKQKTPDAGLTEFRYDDNGQLRYSQNAKQLAANPDQYSFTNYDRLGRSVVSGQLTESSGGNASFTAADTDTDINLASASPAAEQVTRTYYSEPAEDPLTSADINYFNSAPQRFLRNRVSYTEMNNTNGDIVRNYYSYDPHGNVEWFITDIPTASSWTDNSITRNFLRAYTRYEYDLISNKVKQVNYNELLADRFFHKYEYDEQNRIKDVYTSRDSRLWERDANYSYYPHGPLGRVTLGQDKVQGIDYRYTLQGWLKGINGPVVSSSTTIGDDDDGTTTGSAARDVFSMRLNYYTGDFGNSSFPDVSSGTDYGLAAGTSLYNGNIASWSSDLNDYNSGTTTDAEGLIGSNYTYDAVSRLKTTAYNKFISTAYSSSTDYSEAFTYDPNGNIYTLERSAKSSLGVGGASINLDNLEYTYKQNGSQPQNRLDWVDETLGATAATDDIEAGQAANNYRYDEIGNLTYDIQEEQGYKWNIYGKLTNVDKINTSTLAIVSPTTTKRALEFAYNANGNRVSKTVDDGTAVTATYYVQDASGNTLAVYEQADGDAPLAKEFSLYGSDRVGQYYSGAGITYSFVQPDEEHIHSRQLNSRIYELKDHLGNIRATVTDKIGLNGASERIATVQTMSNYYAFGSPMPGRVVSPTYRYGFNGQEKTDEIKGLGNHNTAKFWEYDTRLGRRWNRDPVVDESESPFATNKNNPIKNDDPNGDCSTCPPPGFNIGAKASLSFTFGTKGQSRLNFAVGIGASKTSGNFMGGANLSLNLYTGGPGTSQASTGQSSLGGALTLGLSGTFGSGTGRPTDVNIFNSSTISGVTNKFKNSGTIGTNLTYNTATGFNRAWGVASKFGGFTASLNEDFSLAKKAGHGILASGYDEGETGGGFLGYTFKNGTSVFAGTEIFTGKPTSYPKTQSTQYPGFVNQTDAQQQLNVGRTFLKVENAPGIGNIRFDYSGRSQMWSQNAIHDAFGYYRFRSTAENSFQITK